MASITHVAGVRNVINNLRRADARWDRGIERGLKKGSAHLIKVSRSQVPVEFGVLKASWFLRSQGTGYGTKVAVGYTAAYAAQVHERVRMSWRGRPRLPNPPHKGRYWDPIPSAKAKFLEDPVRTEASTIRQIVIDEARKSK